MLEYTWQTIWALERGWLTPTVLFVVLNIVIGTIALSSRGGRAHHGQRDLRDDRRGEEHRPIARASSSVLERLRSVSLYRFRSGDYPFEAADQIPGNVASTQEPEGAGEVEEHRPMPRTSSSVLLERLRSLSLYRFRSGDHLSDDPTTEPHSAAGGVKEHHYGPSKSESQPQPPVAEGRMKKAASSISASAREDEEVDARADDFINRFKQQLKLQRLNSILNYTEMLNHGK